jgi:hypothetical protein
VGCILVIWYHPLALHIMATWIITHYEWLLALSGILVSILLVNAVLKKTQASNQETRSQSTIGNKQADYDLGDGYNSW